MSLALIAAKCVCMCASGMVLCRCGAAQWKGVKASARPAGPNEICERRARGSDWIGNRCGGRAGRGATRCSIASRELLTFALALLSAPRSALYSTAVARSLTVLRSVRAESSSRLLARRSIGSGTERSGAFSRASVGQTGRQTVSRRVKCCAVFCCVVLCCSAASQ